MYTTPTEFWQEAWQLLQRAQHDRRHPYRTPVISTVSPTGLPEARTVVLRKVDFPKSELWLYTDRRSKKYTALAQGANANTLPTIPPAANIDLHRSKLPTSSQPTTEDDQQPSPLAQLNEADVRFPQPLHWLFWDPKKQLQISATGSVRELAHPASRHLFMSLPKHSRKTYATTTSPGTSLPHATDGLPDDWEERSLQATNYALEQFCVLITKVECMDILWLNRAGHRRVSAERISPHDWKCSWVTP